MSNTVSDFADSGVQDMHVHILQNQVAGEVSLTPGTVLSAVVSLKDFRCKGIHKYRRFPVSIDLYTLRKARRNLFFIRPSLATLHPLRAN